MSYIGTTKIGTMYLGSTSIGKAYLGTDLVFQKGGGGGGGDLPPGGIQCDYLYSDASGTDRFIESGITPGTTMSYEAVVKWALPGNAGCEAFGWNISNRRYTAFRFYNMTEDVGFDAYYNKATPSFPKVIELKCKAVITQTGAVVDFYNMDDTLYNSATFTYSETDYTPNQTLPIMGKKTSATAIENGSFRGGLGRVKMYDDDHFGHLIADFNPCYLNGVFGMFEVVSQTFKAGVNASAIWGIGQHWGTQDFWPNAAAPSNYPALNNDSNGLVDDRGFVTSRTFTIPAGCTSVRFNAGTVNGGGRIEWYQANNTYRDYNGYNTQDRVVGVPSNATQVRLRINRDLTYLNNAYLYDVTHGEYIWKGIDVQ